MKNSDLKRFYEPDNSNNNEGFARLNESGKLDAPVASNKIDTGNTADGKLMAANGQGGVKFVDDNSGTTVVANPTLAGTEAGLTGLQVGETKYKVDAGTTVVANPTLAGTEADLEGLQVGDTKYKIPSGGSTSSKSVTLFDIIDTDEVENFGYAGYAYISINDLSDLDSWCLNFAQAHGYTGEEGFKFNILFYPTLCASGSENDKLCLLAASVDDGGTISYGSIPEVPAYDNIPVIPGPFGNFVLYALTDGSDNKQAYQKATVTMPSIPIAFSDQ